jgi:integrase
MAAIKSVILTVKKPGKKRRSFAVVKDTKFVNGKRTQVQIDDPRIDSININLQRNLLTIESAWSEFKILVDVLKKEANILQRESMLNQVTENNRKVFNVFWKDKYDSGNLKNEESTRNDILGALRSIEPLSITTATKQEIKLKLNALPVHQQRRYVIRINQLLEFLNRSFNIDKKTRESREIDYVTWEELQKILPYIYSEEVKSLAIALWGTGVRVGEAFAPGFTRLKPNGIIFISKQMDLQRNIRDIKNCKPHHTMLLPQAKKGYLQWCEVSTERKEELRNAAILQIIAASKKAFPNKKDKQVSAHDLRHSYAIHWLGLGASLTQIANTLGDTVATVQLHYTGFVMTDEQIEGMVRLLR